MAAHKPEVRPITVLIHLLILCCTGVATSEPRVGYTVFQILEMNKIDGIEQTFYVDFYLTLLWQEPELTVAPSHDGESLNATQLDFIQRTGTFEFINVKDAVPAYQEWLGHTTLPAAIRDAGLKRNDTGRFARSPWVEYDARWKGYFSANLNLIDFPFDFQEMVIQIEPLWWTDQDFIFAPGNWTESDGVRSTRPMAEWTISHWWMTSSLTFYPQWDSYYARNTAWAKLKQKADYYVEKIMLGIIMITLMSHVSFCVPASDTNRLGFVLTCFLGVITYLFVISAGVPKVAYTTRLDQFVNLSFFTIFSDFMLMTVEMIIDHALFKTVGGEDSLERRFAAAEEETVLEHVVVVDPHDGQGVMLTTRTTPDAAFQPNDFFGQPPTHSASEPISGPEDGGASPAPPPAGGHAKKPAKGRGLSTAQRRWKRARRPLDFTLTGLMLLLYITGVLWTFAAGAG